MGFAVAGVDSKVYLRDLSSAKEPLTIKQLALDYATMAQVVREYALRGGALADLDVLSMMHEPWFVPDTTTLEEQLQAFRAHRSHFALVVDEDGALQGDTREWVFQALRDITGQTLPHDAAPWRDWYAAHSKK